MTQETKPLPRFTWTSAQGADPYERLRSDLWPTSNSSVPALDGRIEWLPLHTHSEAMDVTMEDDIDDPYDEPPARIGFIDLKTYSTLEIPPLSWVVWKHGDHAEFVVRHEYDLFFEHALSRVRNYPQLNSPTNFFVTGTPGIGLSFGCYYFLLRLLALGQPVFLVESRNETVYFSSDGLQETSGTPSEHDETSEAIRSSWVLVNIDDSEDFTCPRIYYQARCVIWTSSPHESRMRRFCNKFHAETWYMKTWSSTEIGAVTQRFKMDPRELQKRMDTKGPVARGLFTPAVSKDSAETLERNIIGALNANIFNNAQNNFMRVEDVLKIEPLVMFDSGRARLRRSDFSTDFLSAHIAQRTLDLLHSRFELLQKQLAATFYDSTLAGQVVEGLMHRALEGGMKLPRVFGPVRTVVQTLTLTGNPETFVCETTPADQRPLYLRPKSQSLAAVDAVLVTGTALGLVQTSLNDSSESHILNFGTILRIMSRLADGARIEVNPSWDLIFCLIAISPPYLTRLVDKAKTALAELQKLNAEALGAKLSVPCTDVARERISKLRVLGYTFHPDRGFEAVA
ncbi:hypothetical protein MSAN_02520200 [Mycena sanguinolenta]|uniref:Uncharacterized protein n=1 Tax=Mycena sanguinolenta TaxID=230812 RepID=A0A8H6TZ86_9AGAR|nr:hypothetical protein MSAN_02520200 [Mycena sanguinolenta]